MREELCDGIEGLTGRRVFAFISGNNSAPHICSELFLLDGSPNAEPEPDHRHPEPTAKMVRRIDWTTSRR
jgi:hypothetical protein